MSNKRKSLLLPPDAPPLSTNNAIADVNACNTEALKYIDWCRNRHGSQADTDIESRLKERIDNAMQVCHPLRHQYQR